MKLLRPPSGFEHHLSRRAAAALLGFASEFKVRELEKQGRLHPVRGAMGSAWYPRAEVLALREAPAPTHATGSGALARRWTDSELIEHLRGWVEPAGEPRRPRSVVDLVADTGIAISRADRVYRFWLAHDLHPAAEAARTYRRKSVPAARASATPAPLPVSPSPAERRSEERLERDSLLGQMRHPDPKVRADAFAKLKRKR